MEAVNTLVLVSVLTEKLGTQVVSRFQEAVLGAPKPGLGARNQVPQVVVIVCLHKALESPGDPAGEGTSQLRPPTTPRLARSPLLPQTQELSLPASPAHTHWNHCHFCLVLVTSGSSNFVILLRTWFQELLTSSGGGLRVPANTFFWHSR